MWENDTRTPAATNGCVSIQERMPDLVDSPVVRSLLLLLYTAVGITGVVGNCLLLYMVLLRRLDMSVRTVFIVSLSCSDLLMSMTSLPVSAVTNITRVWVLPEFLCYSIGLLQGAAVFVSSFTLILIAVDRFLLIRWPHSNVITYERAKLAVALFWLTGAVLATPMSAFVTVESVEDRGLCGSVCWEEWPKELQPHGKRLYGVTVFLIQYGIPSAACTVCYVQISQRVTLQFERRMKAEVVSAETAERSLQRRRHANRMMVVMVASFVLTWLPFNLVNLVRDFDLFEYFLPHDYFTIVFSFSHLVAMTSILCNPIIYSFFNQQYRNALMQLFRSRRLPYSSTKTVSHV